MPEQMEQTEGVPYLPPAQPQPNVPPSVGATSPPPVTEQITPDRAAQDQLLTERKANTAQAVGGIESLGAKRDAMLNAPTPRPAQPKLQNIPAAPQQQFQNVFKEGAPGLVFATVMGSLMSKRAGMGAMQAATGYMEGFQKGDEAKMALARTNWENSVKQVVAQNNVEKERYDAVWNNTRMSQQEKMAKVHGIAAAVGDQQTILALKNGDLDFAQKLISDRTKAAQHLEETRLKAAGPFGNASGDQQQAIEKLGWNQQTVDAAAQTYNKTGRLPTNLGSRQFAGIISGAIQKRAAEMWIESGKSLEDRPKEWQTFKAEEKAIADYFRPSSIASRTITSLNTVTDHLTTLLALSDAMNKGDTPVINELRARIAQMTGQHEPTNFTTAARIVAPEVIKAIGVAGAGTGVERAAHELARSTSDEQAHGAIATLQKLLGGQLASQRGTFVATTGLPGEKFDERLFPATQKFLGDRSAGGAAAAPAATPQTGQQRPRAKNPQTGEEVEWDGTAWQPVKK